MKYGLLVIVLLSGCSSMPRGEWAYQGLHFVDTMQTLNGPARDSECYHEHSSITRRIIGRKPSQESVIGWGIGMAGFHYGVSLLLDSYAPEWMLTTWQAVTVTRTGTTVYRNAKEGINLYGDNTYNENSVCWRG